MGPKTLVIFDFDWVLFRTPTPPENITFKSFINSPESLEPPHVPLCPNSDYWINRSVKEFKSAQHRIDTITALITARRQKTEYRIIDLIQQKGLDPDFAYFRDASYKKDKYRLHFKRCSASKILRQYDSITKMIVWDEEQEAINEFEDLANYRKIRFEHNLVYEPKRFYL